jgi:hypothetical protein
MVPGCWLARKRDALLGASGDHGLVSDLLWDDVREWFEPDRGGRLGEAFLQPCGLVLEPGALGVSRVGLLADLVECAEASLEFFAQVRVGAAAVEGGAVDSCLAGEGLDVAPAAGRDKDGRVNSS